MPLMHFCCIWCNLSNKSAYSLLVSCFALNGIEKVQVLTIRSCSAELRLTSSFLNSSDSSFHSLNIPSNSIVIVALNSILLSKLPYRFDLFVLFVFCTRTAHIMSLIFNCRSCRFRRIFSLALPVVSLVSMQLQFNVYA